MDKLKKWVLKAFFPETLPLQAELDRAKAELRMQSADYAKANDRIRELNAQVADLAQYKARLYADNVDMAAEIERLRGGPSNEKMPFVKARAHR